MAHGTGRLREMVVGPCPLTSHTFALNLGTASLKKFCKWLPSMVCISWSLSLSLQNTLIGCHSWSMPFTHLKGTTLDFRTTIVAVDLRTFSSPPKGNPVPLAVSSDPPFWPARCGPNQARSHSGSWQVSPVTDSENDWHRGLRSLIFAPSSFRRRQKSQVLRQAAERVRCGLILSSPAKFYLSIKKGRTAEIRLTLCPGGD